MVDTGREPLHSAIYEGVVHHQRCEPLKHEFRNRLFMVYLDLDELDRVFRHRWLWSTRRPALAWFRRSDFFGDPKQPLSVSIRSYVRLETGRRLRGPIRLLTHLRYFGYSMNPVSFYYCYEADGTTLDCIVADVHNTPWGESYAYIMHRDENRSEGDGFRHRFDKRFHVSPFMGMDQSYHWRFSPPDDTLSVHMTNLPRSSDVSPAPLFHARLQLERRPLTSSSLAWALIRYPLMTAQVVAGIYWQAFRLWRKKCPFHSHPKHLPRHGGHTRMENVT